MRLMTVSEVADAKRVSRAAVHKWIASGHLVPDETVQATRAGKSCVVAYLFTEAKVLELKAPRLREPVTAT